MEYIPDERQQPIQPIVIIIAIMSICMFCCLVRFISYAYGVLSRCCRFEQMDAKYMKMAMESLQGALPLRIGSINICYPPTFFRLVWAIINPFLHE